MLTDLNDKECFEERHLFRVFVGISHRSFVSCVRLLAVREQISRNILGSVRDSVPIVQNEIDNLPDKSWKDLHHFRQPYFNPATLSVVIVGGEKVFGLPIF